MQLTKRSMLDFCYWKCRDSLEVLRTLLFRNPWSSPDSPLAREKHLWPLIISRSNAPKPYTSDLTEKTRLSWHSGAVKPLQQGNRNVSSQKMRRKEPLVLAYHNRDNNLTTSYIEPTMRSANSSSTPGLYVLDKPKSEILGFMLVSKRMLLGFKSPCIICSPQSLWR